MRVRGAGLPLAADVQTYYRSRNIVVSYVCESCKQLNAVILYIGKTGRSIDAVFNSGSSHENDGTLTLSEKEKEYFAKADASAKIIAAVDAIKEGVGNAARHGVNIDPQCVLCGEHQSWAVSVNKCIKIKKPIKIISYVFAAICLGGSTVVFSEWVGYLLILFTGGDMAFADLFILLGSFTFLFVGDWLFYVLLVLTALLFAALKLYPMAVSATINENLAFIRTNNRPAVVTNIEKFLTEQPVNSVTKNILLNFLQEEIRLEEELKESLK